MKNALMWLIASGCMFAAAFKKCEELAAIPFGGVPQLSVQSPLFGKIRSARDPRLIQFALKLLW